jgi:hypothetical protein
MAMDGEGAGPFEAGVPDWPSKDSTDNKNSAELAFPSHNSRQQGSQVSSWRVDSPSRSREAAVRLRSFARLLLSSLVINK